MRINLYSPSGIQFEGEAMSLNVPTRAGEITILDHHRPLISILKKGKAVVVQTNGEKLEYEIESGFLEMDPDNTLTVLMHDHYEKNS